jgi:hypothetical protein
MIPQQESRDVVRFVSLNEIWLVKFNFAKLIFTIRVQTLIKVIS